MAVRAFTGTDFADLRACLTLWRMARGNADRRIAPSLDFVVNVVALRAGNAAIFMSFAIRQAIRLEAHVRDVVRAIARSSTKCDGIARRLERYLRQPALLISEGSPESLHAS